MIGSDRGRVIYHVARRSSACLPSRTQMKQFFEPIHTTGNLDEKHNIIFLIAS